MHAYMYVYCQLNKFFRASTSPQVRREKGESAGFHSNLDSKDKEEGIFEFEPRLKPLTSAYAVRNGTEPEVTNYVRCMLPRRCLVYIHFCEASSRW